MIVPFYRKRNPVGLAGPSTKWRAPNCKVGLYKPSNLREIPYKVGLVTKQLSSLDPCLQAKRVSLGTGRPKILCLICKFYLGGFLKYSYPQSSSIFSRLIHERNHPVSLGYLHDYGNPLSPITNQLPNIINHILSMYYRSLTLYYPCITHH